MIVTIRVTDIRPCGNRASAVYEFTCDEAEDIKNLPTAKTMERPYKNTAPRPGSSCVFTDKANKKTEVYWLCADDEWRNLVNV